MPGYSGITYGNVANTFVLSLLASPGSCAANTTTVLTFNVAGLLTTDQITASKPTFQAGLTVLGAACLTNGVLSIQFGNFTGSPIVPTASETYTLEVNRPANPSSLPNSIT